jgi:hypothetical protein
MARAGLRHDLDMIATSLVKTYARGHGTTYPDLPWEPKAGVRRRGQLLRGPHAVGLAALLALAADREGERLIQRARWGGRLECQWSAVDRTP